MEPAEVRGGIAVVIDLIRASTTIVYALGNGARAMLPCEEIVDALALKAERPDLLLGGERAGVRPVGFDFGNSPAEYTLERVRGRTIAFTTTNGTRALKRCSLADRVLVGAFANLHAVAAALRAEHRPVHLVCAGVGGQPSLEDTLCAGALACAWRRMGGVDPEDEDARLAISEWETVSRSRERFEGALSRSPGGRNLAEAGLASDLAEVAHWDAYGILPELDPGRSSLITGPVPEIPDDPVLLPPT